MKVAVIIINYCQWELTKKCIESLDSSEFSDMGIILIDNNSPEEVPQWVGERKDIRFAALEKNIGFAGGNNYGFEMSLEMEAEFTFFLNNDAEVTPDTIAKLVEFLATEQDSGTVAPAVFYASSPEDVWSAGGVFNPWRVFFDQKKYRKRENLPTKPYRVDFVSGCALMIRTELFKKTGGFPDDYFMYYEDAELCRKVLKEGKQINVCPQALVYHQVGASMGGESTTLSIYYSFRNRYRYSRGALSFPRRIWFFFYYSGLCLTRIAFYVKKRRFTFVPVIIRAYLSGLSGEKGKSARI